MIEEIELKGKWKLPENDTWLNGTLLFSQEKGSRLELFGTFNIDVFNQTSKEVIIGLTNDGPVTLLDNWYRGKRVRIKEGITIGVYEPNKILKGHNFEREEDVKFERVIFKSFNLFQWISKTGQNLDFRNNSYSYSIHYEAIDKIEFTISDSFNGSLCFDSPLSVERDYNSINLREESYVNFEYSEQKPLDEILHDISIFTNLITLLTYEQSYPMKITLRDKSYIENKGKFSKEKNIKCLYQNSLYDEKHKLRNRHSHLVKYSDVENKFPEIISNWYTLYNEINPVIKLMLNHFKSKYLFTTDKFMDIIRALESFHRHYYNNERLPEEDFIKLKKEIIEQVKLSEDDKKWLESKLYGNEPSLSSRLKDLIFDNSNEFIKENIPNLNKFCYKVVDSRNYYTHYSKDLENRALYGSKLSEITRILRGLLFSCILEKIGVDNSCIKEGLSYNLS